MNSSPDLSEYPQLKAGNIPSHVAIIMDGNGRWAKKRFMNRIQGHEKGSETVRRIVRTSREIGISILTLYAFSTENWDRPKAEVSALMTLLNRFLRSEKNEMLENNIRLNAIGQIQRLPENVSKTLKNVMDETSINDGMLLNLALSYGSRNEIVEMVKQIASEAVNGGITPDSITESTISDNMFTKGMTDPDILIRTSGEMRISNFLLWQIAYSELFFTQTLWPEFSKEEYVDILAAYQSRDRRYGKVKT